MRGSRLSERLLATGLMAMLGLSAAAFAETATTQPAKPYPLDTCVVSGEKLGEMGKPVTITHEGQEIKFCCRSCVAKFKKNPEKYMEKINAAAATTQPAAE